MLTTKKQQLLFFKSLCVISTIFLIANAACFVQLALIKIPQADDYRLTIFHLMPWFEGGWTVSSLWGDVHPNPIHGLILIFSAEFERLSFDSLPAIIIVFMVLKWAGYYFSLTLSSKSSSIQNCLFFFAAALVIFSFNSTMQYRWNSVGIAQIYHAIGSLYLVCLACFIRAPESRKYTFLLLFVALLFQLIARQYSIIWIVASLLTVFCCFVVVKGRDNNRLLKFVLIFVLVFVLEYFFHQAVGTNLRNRESASFMSFSNDWLSRPMDLLKYLIISISSTIINPRLLKLNFNMSDAQIITISIGFVLVYLTAVVQCIKHIRKTEYQIALTMLCFTLITILAGLLNRTDASTTWMQAHITRYVSFRDVSTIAILWVFINHSFKTRLFAGCSSILLVVLVCMQIHYTKYNWNYLKTLESYKSTLRQQLVYIGEYLDANPDASPVQITHQYEQQYKKKLIMNLGKPIKNNNQIRIIKFWKKHKLNLFGSE